MEPRQIIRSSIAASAIVHLSFLLLLIFFTEVHPFRAATPDSVSVDIVTPDEVTEKPPEPPPSPKPQLEIPDKAQASDAFDLSAKAAPAPASPPPATAPPAATTAPPAATTPAATTPATAAPAAAASPAAAPQQAAKPSQPPAPAQKQAALPQPAPDQRQPAGQPQAQAQSPSPPPPAYVQPQPDLSIKYHVLLGLPQAQPGDGFDAPATEKADVGSSPIAQFRQHLKTCSTLPKEVAPSDKVAIKLRVAMTPDGRLAAEPQLIEASASMKGPLLMRSAISALRSCQPYTMMPADKYKEWKVLDLSFTPQDFDAS